MGDTEADAAARREHFTDEHSNGVSPRLKAAVAWFSVLRHGSSTDGSLGQTPSGVVTAVKMTLLLSCEEATGARREAAGEGRG